MKYKFGFECASIGEIRMVLESGATAQDIIYCNPCKQLSHLIQSYTLGVRIMSFDNQEELKKIAKNCPDAKLILRILVDEAGSFYKLGSKFGANEHYAKALLQEARMLNMDVCGISFHVGSYCGSPIAFTNAIVEAKNLLNFAMNLGFETKILDIGGGFQAGSAFEETAHQICQSIELIKTDFPNLSVIAEPGRYFAEPLLTVVTQIISKKMDNGIQMYYINDGVYGSFNCSLYDCPKAVPIPLNQKNNTASTHLSCVWGPTCDSYDCVVKKCDLPLLEIGDWIYFENMGGYSISLTCPFNGFEAAKIFYIGL
jgi:ornithine decarboxylase